MLARAWKKGSFRKPVKVRSLYLFSKQSPSRPYRNLALNTIVFHSFQSHTDLAALEKDYEEVGAETSMGEGEEEDYDEEF